MEKTRDELLSELEGHLGPLVVNGSAASRLPNTLSVQLPGGCRAADVVRHCSETVAFSAGSACNAGKISVSSVLAAMGVRLLCLADEPGDVCRV